MHSVLNIQFNLLNIFYYSSEKNHSIMFFVRKWCEGFVDLKSIRQIHCLLGFNSIIRTIPVFVVRVIYAMSSLDLPLKLSADNFFLVSVPDILMQISCRRIAQNLLNSEADATVTFPVENCWIPFKRINAVHIYGMLQLLHHSNYQ